MGVTGAVTPRFKVGPAVDELTCSPESLIPEAKDRPLRDMVQCEAPDVIPTGETGVRDKFVDQRMDRIELNGTNSKDANDNGHADRGHEFGDRITQTIENETQDQDQGQERDRRL